MYAVHEACKEDFNKAALDKIPEGYFKFLLRCACFAHKKAAIDDFPIERVMHELQPGNERIYLQRTFNSEVHKNLAI